MRAGPLQGGKPAGACLMLPGHWPGPAMHRILHRICTRQRCRPTRILEAVVIEPRCLQLVSGCRICAPLPPAAVAAGGGSVGVHGGPEGRAAASLAHARRWAPAGRAERAGCGELRRTGEATVRGLVSQRAWHSCSLHRSGSSTTRAPLEDHRCQLSRQSQDEGVAWGLFATQYAQIAPAPPQGQRSKRDPLRPFRCEHASHSFICSAFIHNTRICIGSAVQTLKLPHRQQHG